MSDRGNPWVVETVEPAQPVPAEAPRRRWAPGAEVHVSGGLPVVWTASETDLWVVGAHGGAGATSWAHLLRAGDAGAAWPNPGRSVKVLVVARRNHTGLARARQAAMQWAQGGPLAHVDLVGLLVAADAPGRGPKALRDEARLTAGAFPTVIEVGWVDAWRLEEAWECPAPRDVRRAVAQVQELRREHA
jgi:hypothetical protein